MYSSKYPDREVPWHVSWRSPVLRPNDPGPDRGVYAIRTGARIVRGRNLFIMNDPYHGIMRFRYPFLILTLMVLAYSCVAGCMYKDENYGMTPKPVSLVLRPKCHNPRYHRAGIPSVATSIPAGLFISFPDLSTGIK